MSITFVEIKYNEIFKFDYNGKKAKNKNKNHFFYLSTKKKLNYKRKS